MTKDFTIYFPWDQYVITPEAQQVVAEAAQYATGAQPSNQVIVTGYTDTSGTAAYNMRLSERRAKATADQLVADGVPQTALSVNWKGETDLAVPTPNGVREPLNRRAVIDVNF